MKKLNNEKINIMSYTYGHGVPTVSDFPPEIMKALSHKKVIRYKSSFIDNAKSLYFTFMIKFKNFPFKILSLFENKILIAKGVLSDLECSQSSFNFSSHCWVDIMGGTGVWTQAIEELSLKKALNIDIQTDDEFRDNRLKLYSKNRITGNILNLQLDKSIDAVFVRSGLRSGVLEDLLNNNPHIKILVYCQIKYSLDGSIGLQELFKHSEKFSIHRSNSFELDSVSNLKFNSKSYSYDFHVFTR